MNVQNIISDRSGEAVRNQFVIHDDNGNIFFQSYNSTCAKISSDGLTLGSDWDYSITTLKYLYIFLRDYGYKYYRLIQDTFGKVNKSTIYKALDQNIIDIDYNL